MFFVIFSCMAEKVSSLSVEIDLLTLSKNLNILDQKITSFLSKPECTMRDAFLTWFEEYNKLLCQLVSMLNDEEIRAEPVVRKLLLGGGPTFLKVDVDNELLKEHLYWGDRDVEEMYYCIGVTKVLWFEIKNVLSPYGERHIRNINVPHELYELDVWGCLNEDIHFTKLDIKDPRTNFTLEE
ncbi:hypothetical protein J6590_066882 [Homalodisca vitripennis]|nr:hypothetical protein J6590_066882 [Homalodisca vitripennis]